MQLGQNHIVAVGNDTVDSWDHFESTFLVAFAVVNTDMMNVLTIAGNKNIDWCALISKWNFTFNSLTPKHVKEEGSLST